MNAKEIPKPPAPFKDWLDYMVLDGFARPISAKEDSGLLLYPVGWIEEQASAELASLRASAREAAERAVEECAKIADSYEEPGTQTAGIIGEVIRSTKDYIVSAAIAEGKPKASPEELQ